MQDLSILQDLLPYTWPEHQDQRIILINNLKDQFHQILQANPCFYEKIRRIKQNLALQGPYYELIEEFEEETYTHHKLKHILQYLHFEGEQRPTNLKQFLNPQKLQKLICDIYRIFNRTILDYQAKSIVYPQYLKLSLSIFKKISNQNFLDQNTFNFICHYASRRCYTLRKQWQDFDVNQPKYIGLTQCLKRIQNCNQPRINSVLQYFNKQQLILCFILYCIIQCEELIAISLGEQSSNSLIYHDDELMIPQEISSEDFSWHYNCFTQIRDYFPRLAQKLNKRMKVLKTLPIYNEQTRIQIFNYTQLLHGYQTNFENTLSEDIKSNINQILQYQQIDCDPGLVILVANAKMYTQLMYSLM
ncbi:unnamed protein product [Paramecium pentaurelia]|uniref:Uncharacterized protein n=1 Tax=Paramecium pentaurelia TaxID=43138 RepID=A0A8S1SHA8_9CILI|nr:unnamed protein product [Paramecium pentaurelia]